MSLNPQFILAQGSIWSAILNISAGTHLTLQVSGQLLQLEEVSGLVADSSSAGLDKDKGIF